jgi:magnesium chelatase family protein
VSRVQTAALFGVDGVAVEVEVRISSQLPRIDIVGLPAPAVRESAARVRSAIQAVGHRFPERRVIVNLAPAELRKNGACLDLPIAIAILAQSGALEMAPLEGLGLFGELSLDGRLRPVRGALALALAVRAAGCPRLIVPEANGAESALATGVETFVAKDLAAVIRHLLGAGTLDRACCDTPPGNPPSEADLCEVRGQEAAKRALEIAAAGGHALLLRGAPGAGKTMLARRLPGLLPPLTPEEALEVMKIHGAAGSLREAPSRSRPFRAPHHTASTAGLLGGRNPPLPGEVSLAHNGVLFLDELSEFERRCLESLRQVLEERRVAISRAGNRCVFPADFQLVAASNPCPCGWRGSGRRDCLCDDGAVTRYGARVSGPLLDRIDLHVDVRPLRWRELDEGSPGEASAGVRQRVEAARRRQQQRAGTTNARLADRDLDRIAAATPDSRALLGRALDRFALSARAARRVLKVARTIADLSGDAHISPHAMAEALTYRPELPGSG